jgi:serine/threonine-protein kinase
MVSRFAAEARAVNQIGQRNIIDIFSFGSLDDGRSYFVMELLEGKDLGAYLDEVTRMAPAKALALLDGIAAALDATHQARIVHRDLKPANVFVCFEKNEPSYPKLLNFGIAKLLTQSTRHKTSTGAPMGTPLFMSPEQCKGKKEIDHRTDIYALGVVVHRMLTGGYPFDGVEAMELLIQHATEPPASMSSMEPSIPAAADAVVLRMLAKEPGDRFDSASEAIAALRESLSFAAAPASQPSAANADPASTAAFLATQGQAAPAATAAFLASRGEPAPSSTAAPHATAAPTTTAPTTTAAPTSTAGPASTSAPASSRAASAPAASVPAASAPAVVAAPVATLKSETASVDAPPSAPVSAAQAPPRSGRGFLVAGVAAAILAGGAFVVFTAADEDTVPTTSAAAPSATTAPEASGAVRASSASGEPKKSAKPRSHVITRTIPKPGTRVQRTFSKDHRCEGRQRLDRREAGL